MNTNINWKDIKAYNKGFKDGQRATFDYLIKAGGYDRFHQYLVDINLIVGKDEDKD